MVDMAAIASATGALKTAYDLSKAAISAHDAGAIRAKVAEMQGEISSALASAITAQMDQLAMLNRVVSLEKEVAELKAWDAEKSRYQLEKFHPGVFVYGLKPEKAFGEPLHQLCAACFTSGRKSLLQARTELKMRMRVRICPACKTEFAFGQEAPQTPLAGINHIHEYDPFERK